MITVQPNVLSVTQVNTYIKSVVDGDINLSQIIIVGEISNFTNHYRTGHFYFTLKDETSKLKAVMFSTYNQRLKFIPEDGMKVICFGKISVYDRDGQYQIYVYDMQPDGLGALNVKFEQLKSKLEKEGLFSSENKKEIPSMPFKIGVVTSPTGAAVEDILNIISRRFPLCEVVISPAEVQGENAASSMVQALNKLEKTKYVDLIIIGRGGGSIEDLWAFNDEALARTIFNVTTPVISAVGHETDFTICDFVSDLRAPTPSAAAELAVPDISEVKEYITGIKSYIKDKTISNIDEKRRIIEVLRSKPCFYSQNSFIEINKDKINMLSLTLDKIFGEYFDKNVSKVNSLYNKLDALNPMKVLLRGYSIVQRDFKTVNSVKNINKDDDLTIKMSDGKVKCKVLETEIE